ncbi:MAG: YlxR family protein [Elainellaceae cyanobacterium]
MEPNYRRCISCRRVAHKDNFWRVVRTHPSHRVQLDEGMGRSAYLCPNAACLRNAQRKNRLGRVLRIAVPEEVFEALWQRLETAAAAK